jgi:hypothetical protein
MVHGLILSGTPTPPLPSSEKAIIVKFVEENFPACKKIVFVGIDGDGKMMTIVLQNVLHLHAVERTITLGTYLLKFQLSFMVLYAI